MLLIGAMKAGTTTLSRDLAEHPGIFVPKSKEVGELVYDRALTQAGRAAYASYYRFARPGQLRVDAATAYTRLPDFPGVPARAHAVCGPDTRILYMIRNPIGRIVSHHAQVFYRRGISADVNEAVKQLPDFLEYSRYGMQLSAWLDLFPAGEYSCGPV